MTTTTTPALAAFTPAHLPQALRLSRQAGWPHRQQDWALTLSVSQGVVALDGDRVVGTALCSPFGPVATLNMIIVDEAMRGRGLGRTLMDAIIALAGDREMRLVATTDGLPLYEKLGFHATGQIVQHQGIATAAAPDLPVTTGTSADIDRLAPTDRAASGMDRAPLLRAIAAEGEVLICNTGFALLRDFGRGRVVGPITAPDTATARAMLTDAARRCEGTFLRADLRAGQGLEPLAARLGLAPVGGGTAMVRNPQTPDPTTFALISQALG
ncbi:GNAT family N-acetyltransferase [Paracoccus shandongensis]|uniref:GNAT family N-acetyltransferase n=1 Tax=Paracoccus shandongensis TaxID=2816048 RepID=UPI001A8E9577|nr:GNAT family N-acetyltransferase [Paracoccus shandongensis]